MSAGVAEVLARLDAGLPVVLVDGSNVSHAAEPRLGPAALVNAVASWAAAAGWAAVISFDGTAPAGEVPATIGTVCTVVGSGRRSADEWLARAATLLADAQRTFALASSDREVRLTAGAGAQRLWHARDFLDEVMRSGSDGDGVDLPASGTAPPARTVGSQLDDDARARLERIRRGHQ